MLIGSTSLTMLNQVFFKIFLIVILFLFIYTWNKYVPRFIVKGVGNFHRAFNKKNIDRQPIKFILKSEYIIINAMKYFYWICFLAFVYVILTSDFSEFIESIVNK